MRRVSLQRGARCDAIWRCDKDLLRAPYVAARLRCAVPLQMRRKPPRAVCYAILPCASDAIMPLILLSANAHGECFMRVTDAGKSARRDKMMAEVRQLLRDAADKILLLCQALSHAIAAAQPSDIICAATTHSTTILFLMMSFLFQRRYAARTCAIQRKSADVISSA